ncbi:unnamed protein product [Camellia sinensis]
MKKWQWGTYNGIEDKTIGAIPVIQIISSEMLATSGGLKVSILELSTFKTVSLYSSHIRNRISPCNQWVLPRWKLVAPGIEPLNRMPLNPTTPCNASDHHSYAGMPSRSMAGAELTSWETFSSSVRRETRSRARWRMGRVVSQNGYDLVDGLVESHENGGGCVDSAQSTRRRRRVGRLWSFIVVWWCG